MAAVTNEPASWTTFLTVEKYLGTLRGVVQIWLLSASSLAVEYQNDHL